MWGYHRVLDSFQFHITLTDGIARRRGLRALVGAGLRKALEGVLDAPLRIDALTLFKQENRNRPFSAVARLPVRQRTDCTGNSMMSLTVRQERMRLLALASVERLEAGLSAITPPDYEVVRGPETGLVMIRGRVGNTGDAFNMGEALGDALRGLVEGRLPRVCVVLGEDARRAELAALYDALWQRGRLCGTP